MMLVPSTEIRRKRRRRRSNALPGIPLAVTLAFLLLLTVVSCNARRFNQIPRVPFLGRSYTATSVNANLNGNANANGKQYPWSVVTVPRGGANGDASDAPAIVEETEEDDDDDDDEERYSRQVYTMGAKAHGLIRSSTVYVDGPIRSGLLWESIKNLALSGVGKLVLIVNDDEEPQEETDETTDDAYFLSHLDDLGATYIRGARTELGLDPTAASGSDSDLVKLLVDFLGRLNPALEVSTLPKSQFTSGNQNGGMFICVDRPHHHQQKWNDCCRTLGAKFVAVETAGVYAKLFCDFGPHHEIHDADGEAPLVVPLQSVQVVATGNSNKLVVKSLEGEKHDVSRDEIIAFSRGDGSVMEELPCTVTNVQSPEIIEVELRSHGNDESTIPELVEQINSQAVAFSRRKQLQQISFSSLQETWDEAISLFQGNPTTRTSEEIFTPCDFDKSFDENRRRAIFGSFAALDSFVQTHQRMPGGNDADHCFELAQRACSSREDETEDWKRHCQSFFRTCPAKFVPLQAIFGAIAAQECLKGISGLYNPIQQFLLYDCDEVLTTHPEATETASTGMSHILGSELMTRLANQKLFVVGSGAIGCELLKNIAAMGAATGTSGRLVVTDMDTIEKSNLSRQLLFRDNDIGKFKAKAAEEALLRMNPSVTVESHTSKVGDDEEDGPFDANFWSKKVDIVLNALDNMEARLFMDSQCVSNQKALIDAGTLGSKGNVQVVVPHQSESYGSSVDPPEPAIPVCTLKNFPYAIAHTIQWGRDLFDGLYVRRPNQANQYGQEFLTTGFEGLVEKLETELGEEAALEAAKELSQDLPLVLERRDDEILSVKSKAIEWAIQLAKELFHDVIARLLAEHPIDELDEEGELFWSGSRKPPKPLLFSLSKENAMQPQEQEINTNMIEFVRSAARLRYETYIGIPSNAKENLGLVSTEEATEALTNAVENQVAPRDVVEKNEKSKGVMIREKLSTLADHDHSNKNNDSDNIRRLASAEFEKDDESNDHITFITAASNLRAICYGIAPVDAMETRKVAGNIVPAMITTTAFVSALSCLELIKLTQGLPLNRYRNAFINLALPFFAFTSPLPAEEFPGVRGETHTLWDKIIIKEGKKAAHSGGLTLKRFLRRIQKKACADDPDCVQVSNISIGPIMVYANFLHEDDEDLLSKSIWEVIEEAVQSGEEFDEEFSRDGPTSSDQTKDEANSFSIAAAPYVDLVVSVEDTETFEEVELPQVRLMRSK